MQSISASPTMFTVGSFPRLTLTLCCMPTGPLHARQVLHHDTDLTEVDSSITTAVR
jgi:hypothetical protein